MRSKAKSAKTHGDGGKPEEIIEELFGEKNYFVENAFETDKIMAWNRQRQRTRHKFKPKVKKVIVVRLKSNNCQGGYQPFCDIVSKSEKLAERLGYSFYHNGDFEFCSTNQSGTCDAWLNMRYFRVVPNASSPSRLREAKKFATELLKIYLNAHKDCCGW